MITQQLMLVCVVSTTSRSSVHRPTKYISRYWGEKDNRKHPPNPHQFWEKLTFWSETGFGPLLGTSRRLAFSECDFEHFLVHRIFTYLGKFNRWPTLDHALTWDSHGQFSFILHQIIRLDEQNTDVRKVRGCFLSTFSPQYLDIFPFIKSPPYLE